MLIMALVVAGLAAALWVGPAPGRGLARRLLKGEDALEQRPHRRLLIVLGALVGLLPVAALAGGTHSWTVLTVGLVVVLTTGWILRGERQRRRSRRLRGDVAHACRVLAGQLRVGMVPAEAIKVAADDCPVLADAAAVQELGGDVIQGWRRDSACSGGAGLGSLARAWHLSHVTGAPMAPALQQVADDVTAEEHLALLVAGELSSSRATGRVMAALPVVGLGLGYLVGGDPASFLLGHGIGQVMLLVGVCLAAGGICWMDRIAARAEESPA